MTTVADLVAKLGFKVDDSGFNKFKNSLQAFQSIVRDGIKDLKEYAKQAPDRLRAIADDENTPVKVKADIERWFAEMYYGKSAQQVTLDGEVNNTGTTVVKFEGELAKWAK